MAVGFFGQRIFGRLGTASVRPLTYDAIAAEVDAEVDPDDPNEHAWAQAFSRKVSPLSLSELGELYVSLAPYADLLAPKRVWKEETVAVTRMHLCASKCRERPLEVPPAQLRDFVTLIVATRASQYTVSHYAAKRILLQLTEAIAKGGHLTARENELLITYAKAVRSERHYSDNDRRTSEQIAVMIERLAGVETPAMLTMSDDPDLD